MLHNISQTAFMQFGATATNTLAAAVDDDLFAATLLEKFNLLSVSDAETENENYGSSIANLVGIKNPELQKPELQKLVQKEGALFEGTYEEFESYIKIVLVQTIRENKLEAQEADAVITRLLELIKQLCENTSEPDYKAALLQVAQIVADTRANVRESVRESVHDTTLKTFEYKATVSEVSVTKKTAFGVWANASRVHDLRESRDELLPKSNENPEQPTIVDTLDSEIQSEQQVAVPQQNVYTEIPRENKQPVQPEQPTQVNAQEQVNFDDTIKQKPKKVSAVPVGVRESETSSSPEKVNTAPVEVKKSATGGSPEKVDTTPVQTKGNIEAMPVEIKETSAIDLPIKEHDSQKSPPLREALDIPTKEKEHKVTLKEKATKSDGVMNKAVVELSDSVKNTTVFPKSNTVAENNPVFLSEETTLKSFTQKDKETVITEKAQKILDKIVTALAKPQAQPDEPVKVSYTVGEQGATYEEQVNEFKALNLFKPVKINKPTELNEVLENLGLQKQKQKQMPTQAPVETPLFQNNLSIQQMEHVFEKAQTPVLSQITTEILAKMEALPPKGMTFEMELNPAQLGKIVIKLVSQAGKVSLEITAGRQETAALLQNRAENMTAILRANGVELETYQVNTDQSEHYDRERNDNQSNKHNERQSNENQNEQSETDTDFSEFLRMAI
ncbi:MAG: flagellar hook-length control protein FliK [Oscillospiraceae bacterium]|nr:flagellar hook-length control protein FliK [Oscillospiraceae bacterium]